MVGVFLVPATRNQAWEERVPAQCAGEDSGADDNDHDDDHNGGYNQVTHVEIFGERL